MHFLTILFPLFDANNILDRNKPLVLFFFYDWYVYQGLCFISQKPCHRLRVERRGREERKSLWISFTTYYTHNVKGRSLGGFTQHIFDLSCMVNATLCYLYCWFRYSISVEALHGSAISPVFCGGAGGSAEMERPACIVYTSL